MRKRIAITALSALFAAGSLFGAFAKPALAAEHDRAYYQHHHAYQNANHPGWVNGRPASWNNGRPASWNNGRPASWNNGRHLGWTNGQHVGWNNRNTNRWTGNRDRWNRDHNRDRYHHRAADHRR